MPRAFCRRSGVRLQRRDPRARDACGFARDCSGRGLRVARTAADHADLVPAGYCDHCRTDRLRQVGNRTLAITPVAADELRVAVLRHPMPYGDLAAARVQRFATTADIDAARCTVEEREEYEPHVVAGNVVFAGVDYAEILRQAELEADIIVWDGGNNDFPFVTPGLHVTVADALRPQQVTTHHPGETVARMADVFVINKVDSAAASDIALAEQELRAVNARADIVRAASPIRLDDAAAVRGRRVLVVEDGPTVTHGGMSHGAGYLAAVAAGAVVVDPRGSAVPGVGGPLKPIRILVRFFPPSATTRSSSRH